MLNLKWSFDIGWQWLLLASIGCIIVHVFIKKSNLWRNLSICFASIAMLHIISFAVVSDESQPNYLHCAAGNGDLLYAKWLVNVRHFDVNRRGDFGMTPIQVATQENQLEVISWLVSSGADLYTHDNHGRSVLANAALYGKPNTVEYLIKLAPDLIENQDKQGLTPLFLACANGKLENIQCLLKHKANPFQCDNKKNTLLHIAISCKDMPTIQFIAATYPSFINMANKYNVSSLHMAAENNNFDIISFLLEHGADANATTNDGRTPADIATNDAVKILLKKYQETGNLLKKT